MVGDESVLIFFFKEFTAFQPGCPRECEGAALLNSDLHGCGLGDSGHAAGDGYGVLPGW